MTPEQLAEATVRIATGLLGWERDTGPNGDEFRLSKPRACVTFTENYRSIMHAWSANGEGPYLPDLTTLDGCAEFERELARRGWFERYAQILIGAGEDIDQRHVVSGISVYATKGPAERVWACLCVMDEAGL